jgi:hypothetical protein
VKLSSCMPHPLLLLHATIQFSVYNSYKSGPTSDASHIDEDFPARRPDPTGAVILAESSNADLSALQPRRTRVACQGERKPLLVS